MARSTKTTEDAGAMVPTAEFTPIALPKHVRRRLQAAPHDAQVEVLRDGVVLDAYRNDKGQVLSRVRQLVQQSVERNGHGTFTVVIDDSEEGWASNEYGDDGASLSPQRDADDRILNYAARMESVAFRALNQCNAQQAVTTAAVTQIGKAIKSIGKSVKSLAKMHQNLDNDTPEVKMAAMEHEATAEHIGVVKDILPLFTGKPRKDKDGNPVMPTFVKAVWALATEEDRKRVLATDEGVVFRNAPDDRTARVALRALWSLVKSGELKISDELAAKGTALFNGEAP